MLSIFALASTFLVAYAGALAASPSAPWQTFRPDQRLQLNQSLSTDESCRLFRHNPEDSVLGFSSGFQAGQQTIVLVDPSSCSAQSPYPFEITAFTLTLVDPPNSYDPRLYKWPVQLEVVVYDMLTPTDPCDGPGTLICSFPVSCDSVDFAYPSLGEVPFPTPCCVDQPFFIGVRYVDSSTSTLRLPSILWDTESQPDTCDIFQLHESVWYSWLLYWISPGAGFPFFWIDGVTRSLACCDDSDRDLICLEYDNCPSVANSDQADVDLDGVGDQCDNCTGTSNQNQADTDSDGVGDACDNCPDLSNPGQEDADADNLGDFCDPCPSDPSNDIDFDGICGGVDNCPGHANPAQEDADSDGTGDACEVLDSCFGLRGNVNGLLDDAINVADLTYFVNFLFRGGPVPPVAAEADVDADGSTNVVDITYLVNYLFRGGSAPAPC